MKYNRAILTDIMAEKIRRGTVSEETKKLYDFNEGLQLRFIDIARTKLIEKGETPGTYGEVETIQRAWSTTDYPDLFTDAVNKILRNSYQSRDINWEFIATRVITKDFRSQKGIKVDGAVNFELIPEGGAYKEAPLLMDESAEIQIKRYGRVFTISYEALVNDNLNALAGIPKMIEIGARQLQAKKVWDLIINNANTPDGKPLFHADHHNYKSSGGSAPSVTSLSEARTAMRRQKSPAGNILGIVPKFLIVPPELETLAEQLVSKVSPDKVENVNVFAGKFEPIVCDLLTSPTEWYLAADPTNVAGADGLVYSAGAGENATLDKSVSVSSYSVKSNDVLKIKSVTEFDAAIWGYQGWYKNAGQ